MGQVPFTTYAIIGGGRLARHLSFYFSLLSLPAVQWTRRSGDDLSVVSGASHVLFLINDDAIEPFIELHAEALAHKVLIHCSGSLDTRLAHGAHPLMSFADELYDRETYEQIPFILEEGGPSFAELFPGLKNRSFFIPREAKPLYHSLCVLAGNAMTMTWQKLFRELHDRFRIPPGAVFPCLERIAKNLMLQPETALTGPIVRGDQATIMKHLRALEGDPFREVYRELVKICHSHPLTLPSPPWGRGQGEGSELEAEGVL